MTLTEYLLNDGDNKTSLSDAINNASASAANARPAWWSTAITLGHLETRMHAIKLLESSAEYRQVVLLYAKKIADEGFRAKAEELIKELFGPVYW
jgi:protein HIRA/HIR1